MMSTASSEAFYSVIMAEGVILAMVGAFYAYESFLGAADKLKPTNIGMRLGLLSSPNYKLYMQDKYWYDIHRHAGKIMLPLSIVWVLLCAAAIILPRDPFIRTVCILIITILVMTALIMCIVHIHGYANKLISGDKQVIKG